MTPYIEATKVTKATYFILAKQIENSFKKSVVVLGNRKDVALVAFVASSGVSYE